MTQTGGDHPKINEKGTYAVVEIKGGGVPKAGSKHIQAKGSLKVSRGTQSKASKSQKVEFKKGGKLKVGNYTFEITKAGKPSYGDDPMEVNLKIDKKLTEIRGFKFLDGSGKEVKSNQSGSSSMGFNNNITVVKRMNK